MRPATSLPSRLFPPRKIIASRDTDGWHFSFLGIERRFTGRITWSAADDPRDQLWSMNLHYMEYLEVLPEADGLAAILDWIIQNTPDRAGGAHDAWNPYALSIRTVCWMQWLAAHGDRIPPADLTTIATSLARQLAWLARRPETDIGGNHLIKNIKAWLWGAACFDGAESARWEDFATDLLTRELQVQVLPDGMHFELSPSYHAQVTADLMECRHVASARARTMIDRRLGGMVSAATLMMHPDGGPAQFNDAGLTMAYAPEALLAAAVTEAIAIPAGCAAGILPRANMAALHTEGFSTFAKFGDIGADALPAHAHGDIGTIELSFGPDRLIVDQGVFEYVPGPRRAASRAAAFHNVTSVEGSDMAAFFGAFRCGYRPRALVHAASVTDQSLFVDVEHDGFAERHHGPATVRRRLHAQANAIKIEDSVSASTDIGWTTRFLLHPAWSCSMRVGDLALASSSATIRFTADAPITLEDAVWWPDMGVELATKRIVIAWPKGRTRLKMRYFSC